MSLNSSRYLISFVKTKSNNILRCLCLLVLDITMVPQMYLYSQFPQSALARKTSEPHIYSFTKSFPSANIGTWPFFLAFSIWTHIKDTNKFYFPKPNKSYVYGTRFSDKNILFPILLRDLRSPHESGAKGNVWFVYSNLLRYSLLYWWLCDVQ